MKTKILKILFLVIILTIRITQIQAGEWQFSTILPPDVRYEEALSKKQNIKTEVTIFSTTQKIEEVKKFLKEKGVSLILPDNQGVKSSGIYQNWIVQLSPHFLNPATKQTSGTIITFTKLVPRGGMIVKPKEKK